jgi:hypothetical protein
MRLVKRALWLSAALVLSSGATSVYAQYELKAGLDVTYEYRAMSDEVLLEDYKYKNGIDLSRAYLDREPFGRAFVTFGAPQGFSVALGTTFRNIWEGDYFKADNLPSGQDGTLGLGHFFLTTAVLNYDSPNFTLAIGRDQVDYSSGLEGSLLPSPRLPFLDNVRSRFILGPFSIDMMAASIQARRSWEASYYNDLSYDVDPNQGLSSAVYGFENDATATSVIEAMHRWSVELPKTRIGATAHIMYARRNNSYNLSDFFPFTSWHQAEMLGMNYSLLFDAEWEPFEGFKAMAQGGFDDICARDIGLSDDDTPTIPAYVIGARYANEVGPGTLSAYLETGYTHWLWGNYDGSEMVPWDVNPLLRFQYRMLMDSGSALLPLTSPYGPGATWAEARALYELTGTGFTGGLSFLILSKNEEANLIDTVFNNNTTTAGAHCFLYTALTLPLQYRWRSLAVSAAPAAMCKDGYWWFEATIALGIKLRGSATIADPRR